MPIALVFALQASAGTPSTRIDLLPSAAQPCPTETSDVVVCGRRDPDRYRLHPLAPPSDRQPIRAETGVIGDLKASATVEQAPMPNGQVSNRVMMNLKLPF